MLKASLATAAIDGPCIFLQPQHFARAVRVGAEAGMRRQLVEAAFRGFKRRSLLRLSGDSSIPAQRVQRILVCRPNHRLGNVLLTTALLVEIERLFPGAETDIVLGTSAGSELLAQFPRVRRVMNLTPRIVQHPLLLLSVLRTIRAAHYDLAIDPTQGSTSGRILMLAAKATFSIGVEHPLTQDSSCDGPQPQHLARLPIDALRRAVRTPNAEQTATYPQLTIGLTQSEREMGRRVLGSVAKTDAGVVGVFADATGRKCHDEAWWVRLIDQMKKRRPDLVFVEFVAAHGKSKLGCRYPTFYSTDARQLCAAISQLDCFISADCGVMHLAAASGATTIGFFSVTDPLRYQPYGGRSQFIRTGDTPPEGVADTCLEIMSPRSERTDSEQKRIA